MLPRLILFIATVMVLPASSHGRGVYGKGNIAVYSSDPGYKVYATAHDSLIFSYLVNAVSGKNLPLTCYINEVAIFFLGTPYVASTLEKEGEEQLVINLGGMDCTTFVEYVLAASLCFRDGEYQFPDFVRQLATIRYRDGQVNGYPSRLHYFSDWLQNNSDKGIIEIVSNQLGKAQLGLEVNFMTSHPDLYRQLGNPLYLNDMKSVENNISGYRMNYVAKNEIESVAHLINHGDIIALVTSIRGLDVSHVGFAFRENGQLHFIHASTTDKKVVVTNKPLSAYLAGLDKITGILIARVK